MSGLPEDDFKDLIAELRRTAPEPPPVHWGAYRAELREKLQRRGSRGWAGWSLLRPFQVAMAAGFVAVLIYIGLPGHGQLPGDPAAMENAILASRLDVITRLDMVQKLDVLEDFDVIERLDSLPASREG